MEDFELFAGVRGKFIHTKNQDHEALINQLLVELDGYFNFILLSFVVMIGIFGA